MYDFGSKHRCHAFATRDLHIGPKLLGAIAIAAAKTCLIMDFKRANGKIFCLEFVWLLVVC